MEKDMSEWAIEAENLIKRFAKRAPSAAESDSPGSEPVKRKWRLGRSQPDWFTAVDGVSLQIRPGEVFGLLGPNGAGKSTTIRMLCTLLEPTSGTARVNGFDIVKQANDVRRSLGTVLG